MSISTNYINYLPREILREIMSHLSAGELCLASRVSKFWNLEANNPQLWKRLYVIKFPDDDVKSLVLQTIKDAFKNRIQVEKDKIQAAQAKKNESEAELPDHDLDRNSYFDYWAISSRDYD